MAADLRTVFVAYDIADARRWRRVNTLMLDHGDRLQLSVFQCRMTDGMRRRMMAKLERIIDPQSDRVLVAEMETGTRNDSAIESFGRPLSAITGGLIKSRIL